MSYPQIPDSRCLVPYIDEYSCLKHEYGSSSIQPLLDETEAGLNLRLKS